MAIKHLFVSAVPDEDDSTLVRPSNWNAEHVNTASVTAFGAKGDGVTDDSSAIQAALDAVKALGGGVVYVPNGTYILSSSINVGGGMTLQGEGWLTQLKKQAGSAGPIITTTTGQNNYFGYIRDLVIDGNKDNCPSGTYGLYLFGTDRYVVESCRITRCKTDGIFLTGESSHVGINNHIRGCYVDSCGGNGIQVENNSFDNIIINSDIGQNTGHGILLAMGNSSGIFNTFCWGNTHGLYSYWGQNLHIVGSRFENNRQHGILLHGCKQVVLTGCNVYLNSTSSSGTYDGIRLAGESGHICSYVNITGCNLGRTDVTESQKYGVNDAGSSYVDYITIGSNTAYGNVTGSYSLIGTHNTTYVKSEDHTKAAHDALGINADMLDGKHASDFVQSTGGLSTKIVLIKASPETMPFSVGALASFVIPEELNNWKVVSVGAHVFTAGTTLTTIALRNATKVLQILSTNITIDANEKDSSTAATAAVVNASNATVNVGDEIWIDASGVGSGVAGLEIRVGFREA